MKTLKSIALSLLFLAANIHVYAQKAIHSKPTIILVHGIWADGTSWAAQITALQAKGYPVIAVQNPITSLADDVSATQRAIKQAKGNVILVGHSWGGFVITQAGNDPKVVALVYVAALAPDLGETLPSLSAKGPAIKLADYFESLDGFIYLSKAGVKAAFAQDLTSKQQDFIYATQIPASQTLFADKSGEPAWKIKKSWFILASSDGAISPELERFMAKRMHAQTIEINASHVVMISHPKEVLKVIEEAAEFEK